MVHSWTVKRFLAVLLCCWLASPAYAAISINVQWDIRTTGSDTNNSGGFVPGLGGTDFSQQDAAQFSGTDLASANGTNNPCTVTSASHNFVTADNGNIINITAGTNWSTGTVSRYEIVSTAGNAATLDRACGTAASLSGGTWNEGGGFQTLAAAVTVATTVDSLPGSVSGTFNVKTGTYTFTSAIAPTSAYGFVWVGYGTSHGDNGTAPTITTATNSINLFNLSGSSHYFDNFNFTNTAGTPGVGINITGGNIFVGRSLTFSGFSNGISDSSGSNPITLIGVEIKNSTADGYNGIGVKCINCYIHNNAGNGITAASADVIVSLISNNTIGVSTTGSSTLATCIYSDIANNSSHGMSLTLQTVVGHNCAIYGNGGFGVVGPGTTNSNVAPVNLGKNNAYGSNTSGNLTSLTAPATAFNSATLGLSDATLSANPFTSATNFAPNSVSGGGLVLKGGGFPGLFPGGLTTGNFNIGAVQSSSAAAGGCTAFCKLK